MEFFIKKDHKPAQKGRWIRLRSNGEKVTLILKKIKSLRIDGTNEFVWKALTKVTAGFVMVWNDIIISKQMTNGYLGPIGRKASNP